MDERAASRNWHREAIPRSEGNSWPGSNHLQNWHRKTVWSGTTWMSELLRGIGIARQFVVVRGIADRSQTACGIGIARQSGPEQHVGANYPRNWRREAIRPGEGGRWSG